MPNPSPADTEPGDEPVTRWYLLQESLLEDMMALAVSLGPEQALSDLWANLPTATAEDDVVDVAGAQGHGGMVIVVSSQATEEDEDVC